MYQLFIHLYLIGVAIASRFNEKVRKMWRGERNAFRVLREQVDPAARYVWFHAASLGEFEQGRPLMEELKRTHPDLKILLTFFSPSGYEVRKDYGGADIICYLPLDTRANARRFLRLVQPEKAFFIKYEFWYNYLHILQKRGVPVYSVSSIFRENQIFFRWYGRRYSRVLRCITHFFVQNEKSRELLARLGLTNVTVTGDTRFDRVLQIKEQARQLPISLVPANSPQTPAAQQPERTKVFIAGSSWAPDEDIFIGYFNEHRDWTLIIAPHVIGEDHLQQIEQKLEGWIVTRYTSLGATHTTWQGGPGRALLIDCFGLLSSIYQHADVTYVGGGFGAGIHNLLEAAVWDVPVIFGPNNTRFQEAQELKAADGGFDIQGGDDFKQLMDRFTAQPLVMEACGQKAGNYVKGRAGATQKILHAVQLA